MMERPFTGEGSSSFLSGGAAELRTGRGGGTLAADAPLGGNGQKRVRQLGQHRAQQSQIVIRKPASDGVGEGCDGSRQLTWIHRTLTPRTFYVTGEGWGSAEGDFFPPDAVTPRSVRFSPGRRGSPRNFGRISPRPQWRPRRRGRRGCPRRPEKSAPVRCRE